MPAQPGTARLGHGLSPTSFVTCNVAIVVELLSGCRYKSSWNPAHLWVVPNSVCRNLTACAASVFLDSSVYYVLAIANNGPTASSKQDMLLTTYDIGPENSTSKLLCSISWLAQLQFGRGAVSSMCSCTYIICQ